MKMKKNPVFFDIRKPFADNYSSISNDDPIPIAASSLANSYISEEEHINATQQHSPVLLPLPRSGSPPSCLDVAYSTTSLTGIGSHTTMSNTTSSGGDGRGVEGAVLSTDVEYPSASVCVNEGAMGMALSRSPSQLIRRDASRSSFVAESYDGEVITFEGMVDDTKEEMVRGVTTTAAAAATVTSAFAASSQKISECMARQQQFRSIPIDTDISVSTLSLSPSKRSPKRRSKRRGGNNSSLPSLEDQIRSVLQHQSRSCVADDDEDGNEEVEEREGPLGLLPDKLKHKFGRVVKSGTVGSLTPVQDILMELRSSMPSGAPRSLTPCTFQSCSSLNSGSRDMPPLGIISIGGGRRVRQGHRVLSGVPVVSSPIENDACTSLLSALAPSRRDVPRHHRMNRKSVVDPHPATHALGSNDSWSGILPMTKIKDIPYDSQQNVHDYSTDFVENSIFAREDNSGPSGSNSSNDNSQDAPPPLGVISIRGQGIRQGQRSCPHDKHTNKMKKSDNESSYFMGHPLALAPSRRDVPRPHRLYRKSMSEPHQAVSAAISNTCSGITTAKPSMPESACDSSTDIRNPPMYARDVMVKDDTKYVSPLERYRRAVGMKHEDSVPANFCRVNGIFPKTSPPSRITTVKAREQLPDSEDLKSTNPLDSPLRQVLKELEFPFEEQSSPISFTLDDATLPHNISVSVEPNILDEPATEQSFHTLGIGISYSSEKTVVSHTNDDLSTPPRISSPNPPPITLLLAPSKRDTLRARTASSFIEESSCTRQQNEIREHCSTVIDAKDDENDNVDHRSWAVAKRLSNKISDGRSIQPYNDVRNENFLDDDVVEDSVWATTDNLFITSINSDNEYTLENHTLEKEQPNVKKEEEEEEESIFVVKRPQNQEWEAKWNAFVTTNYDHDDYEFGTDEWGESDQWNCDEDDSWREETMTLASPTSVAATRKILI